MSPAELFNLLRAHGFVEPDAVYVELDADANRRLEALRRDLYEEHRFMALTGQIDGCF
jgi:hypothetical protein